MKRFKNSNNKFDYMYVLTPRGMKARTKLTLDYMNQKMKKYDELKRSLTIRNNIMKILVTGSSGFIGSHLSEYLVREPPVVAFDRYNSNNHYGWLEKVLIKIK